MAETEDETSENVQNFDPAFDKQGIPLCLSWTVDMVENWIVNLGFPQYKACFATNFINGRKLVKIDASTLPKIGITDFEHTKIISANIRDLLDVEYVEWKRSISLPPREPKTLFLERKSVTGAAANALTYEEHLRELKTFYLHGVPKKHKF